MKIFRLILILALGLQIGFGADENGSSGSGQNVGNANEDYKYYLKYQSKSIVNDGECWVCDEVKDGYVAVEETIDEITGTTYCLVYKKTDMRKGAHIGYANRQVKSCAYENSQIAKKIEQSSKEITANTNQKAVKSSLAEASKSNSNSSGNNGKITFSQFIAGLLTLNPDIINRTNSVLGEIQTNKGIAGSSIDYTIGQGQDMMVGALDTNKRLEESNSVPWDYKAQASTFKVGNETFVIKTDKLDILDSFNKKNMGYFNELFSGMEKIYQHLQVFIFVLIGGFFVMQIGASKLQAYLENRGESEGKQPYLHKFYIPLLMIGIFFMPIPEGNGHQSTVMQNMIRYFAQYSAKMADMAGAAGTNVYLNKIYNSMGNISESKLRTLEDQMGKQIHKTQMMGKMYGDYACCYGDRILESNYNDSNLSNFANYCSSKQNIYKNCSYAKQIENNFPLESNRANQLANDYAIVKHYKSGYMQSLNNIDKYFIVRNQELGWFDVAMTPLASFFIETYLISQASNGVVPDKSMQNELQKINTQKLQIDRFARVNNISKSEAEEKLSNKFDSASDSFIGAVAGRLVWMMMPGASQIKNFIYDPNGNNGKGSGILKEFDGFVHSFFSNIPILGSIFSFIDKRIPVGGLINAGVTITSYYITTIIMEWTFALIPLLTISAATLVAITSYMVTLCKYFYISPFVTAWAMATKRVDKIIDFLLTGISIFFRPVLIVLFVFLSLFLYILINDFFIYVSLEQFSGIIFPESSYNIFNDIITRQNNAIDQMGQGSGIVGTSISFVSGVGNLVWGSIQPWLSGAGKLLHNFHLLFILGAISGFIKIFGSLAGCYVAWKLITGGPSWALGLIGLDGKHDDMVIGGLESNLAKRAFVA